MLTSDRAYAQYNQDTLYIANGAEFNLLDNASVTIWGEVNNHGILGSEVGTDLIFYGSTWRNSSSATMPILTGTGGLFTFIMPRPAPYSANIVQRLEGGNSGALEPSFPNFTLNNGNNVSQVNTGTRVKKIYAFVAGKHILNTNDLFLSTDGVITGYDKDKYVVTNDTFGHLSKDTYLGKFTFPVGMNTYEYTPVEIDNLSANSFKVTVMNYATSRVPDQNVTYDGIGRTWRITADTSTGNSDFTFQHNTSTQQTNFFANAQFVTRYLGANWESNTPGVGTVPGTLTSGTPQATSSEISKKYNVFGTSDSANISFFTKASNVTTPLPIVIRSYNGHCDGSSIRLNWTTGVEQSVVTFGIDKSLDGSTWTSIGSVAAKGANSNYTYLYETNQAPSMLYRLRVLEADNSDAIYSSAIRVGCGNGSSSNSIRLFPNPNNGSFSLGITLTNSQDVDLVMVNAVGQTVYSHREWVPAGGSILQVEKPNLAPGTYYLRTVLGSTAFSSTFTIH